QAGDMPINTGDIATSDNYFETVGMKLLSGRPVLNTDTSCCVVNEAAIKEMRLKEPLNREITVYHGRKRRIVGVVENAILESPFTPVVATVFEKGVYGDDYGIIFYRLKTSVKTSD